MPFKYTPLAVEQNNYATKTLNAYIVYDFGNLPKNSLKNFAVKSCFFGVNNLVKK